MMTLAAPAARSAAATGPAVSPSTRAIMFPPRPPPESFAPAAPADTGGGHQGVELGAGNAHLGQQPVIGVHQGAEPRRPSLHDRRARALDHAGHGIEKRFEGRRAGLPGPAKVATASRVGLGMPLSAIARVKGRPMASGAGRRPRTK